MCSSSNNLSSFKDDGFEDDFTSTASESSSNWVVSEILDTERTYVDDLQQIVIGYIRFLKHQNQQRRSTQDSISTRNSVEFDIDSSLNSSLNLNTTEEEQEEDQEHEHEQERDHESTSEANATAVVVVEEEEEEEEEEDEEDEEEEDDDDDDEEQAPCGHIHHHHLNNHNHNHHHFSNSSNIQQTHTQIQTTNAISSNHIKKLFSNLEDIYKFNKELLHRLEECYKNPSSIAACFVENAQGFDVYTHYCTMYPQVVDTLTELMSDPIAAETLKQRQQSLRQALPLGSYLLKPVQRILKYHILFQSLIKHIADDDSIWERDKQIIDEAYSVMTQIACHINEMKKKHEHAIRVQEIQSLLQWPSGPDLTTMGELLLEDPVVLYSKPKTARHLFLFDNVLLITKKKPDGSIMYKGHIPCSNLMLIEKIDGEPLVFHTVPFDNPKTLFAFQAKNLEKKLNWCMAIKEVMIKSYQAHIPNHVKDILMSLTKVDECKGKSAPKTIKPPDYLSKKRLSVPRKKS